MLSTADTDNWSAPMAYPKREEEEWEKTMCGCSDCWKHGHYDQSKIPDFGKCFKKNALNDELFEKSKTRFTPSVITKDVKRATSEQIAEWAAWLSTPEAKMAETRVTDMTELAKKTWSSHKWDPVKMEQNLLRYVPKHEMKAYVLMNPMWIAYQFYGNEQYTLYNNYKTLSQTIKTTGDYDKTEKAYKALSTHVTTHGLIIEEMPKRAHKMPQEKKDAPTKMGRRATKRQNNSSETSTAMVSRSEARANMVSTVQTYTSSSDDE